MIKVKHLAVIAVLSSAIANHALAQEVGEPGARPNVPGCTNLGIGSPESSGRSIGTVGNSTVWQAPVGHCQPRATDIPGQSKDLAILDPEDAFVDSKISICRGC
jgi:hypothetical protein